MAISGSLMTALGSIAAGAAKVGGTIATGIKAIGASGLAGSMLKGAAVGSLLNMGSTAIQGGSFKDIAKSGAIGAGMGAAGGAVSKGLGVLGSKIQTAVSAGNKGVSTGAAVSAEATTAGQKVNLLPKIETAAPTNITNATANNTPTIIDKGNAGAPVPKGMKQVGYSGRLPSVGGLSPQPQYVPTGTETAGIGNVATSAPAPGAGSAAASTPKTFLNNVKTGLVKAGNAVKNKAGQIGGQVLLQGGLSLITAGMGAKTAKEANEVSRQSLLFQQQTYKEQKEEQDKKEARLKDDAWKAYSSANSFGENLYGSGTNSLLFTTDYKTNPTGNFSILSGNTAKLVDYA